MTRHNSALSSLQSQKNALLFNSPHSPLSASHPSNHGQEAVTDEVVKSYIQGLKDRGVLIPLDHVKLWGDSDWEDEEEDHVGDDLFDDRTKGGGKKKKLKRPSGGGSWILRQSVPSWLGFAATNDKEDTEGEKKEEDHHEHHHIGIKLTSGLEETLYNIVVRSVMKGVVGGVANLHGLGIGGVGEVKLTRIKGVKRAGTERRKERPGAYQEQYNYPQLGIVTEQLLSQMQIAAPLLKLFPIKLQRCLLQNLVIILTITLRDALRGVHLNILGSSFRFDLQPIHFKYRDFDPHGNLESIDEEAVANLAKNILPSLTFMTSWHERVLGSNILRQQVAQLLARIVVMLVQGTVGSGRFDFWGCEGKGGVSVRCGVKYRNGDGNGEEDREGKGGNEESYREDKKEDLREKKKRKKTKKRRRKTVVAVEEEERDESDLPPPFLT